MSSTLYSVHTKRMRRLNVVRMATLLKLIYRFNAVPIIIPDFFLQKLTAHPKIHMERERTKNSQNSLEKKKWNKVGGLTLPNSKLTTKLQ